MREELGNGHSFEDFYLDDDVTNNLYRNHKEAYIEFVQSIPIGHPIFETFYRHAIKYDQNTFTDKLTVWLQNNTKIPQVLNDIVYNLKKPSPEFVTALSRRIQSFKQSGSQFESDLIEDLEYWVSEVGETAK